MAILVLGGAGYIGSHTVYALVEAGRDVVVADNLVTGFRAAVHPKARFYRADIRDRAAMDQIFEQEDIEAVIHFAASSQVGESMTDPLKYYDNNLWGTTCLLKAMASHGVDKIVFSSTAATYGEPEYTPIDEEHPKHPTNAYGESKLIVERMLRWNDHAHGLKYVALRYFNAAGADPESECGECHTPETHLIPRALMAVTGELKDFRIMGSDYPTQDGTCIRDYIHVSDLAAAHVLAMERLHSEASGQGFSLNLGTGTGLSVKEILHAVEQVTARRLAYTTGERRAGDPPVLVADGTRAQEILHWTPRRSRVDTIIEDAWNWHVSGRDMVIRAD